MKNGLSFLAAILFAIFPVFAQGPTIEWQNTIGGGGYDALLCVKQTDDGGYILGGSSDSNWSGDKTENCYGNYDYWVVKLGIVGNIEWQKTIGGNDIDFLTSIQQTTDGGYILGGWSKSNISGLKTENSLGFYDYWVVKLNAAGDIMWQNTIGGNDDDRLNALQQTTDGGYILGGNSYSNISGDKTENSNGYADYWVVKLDAIGAIQWQNTIGGNSVDPLFAIQQTFDKGYVLGGYSYSNISGDKTENSLGLSDYWVVKLNSTGTIQWQNTIGGNGHDKLWALKQTLDGGYILGGSSSSNISGDKAEDNLGEEDYWVMKLDSLGTIQWQNTIGGDGLEEPLSLQQTTDGGYIIGGHSWSNISDDKTENAMGTDDIWVMKLDVTGSIIWQNTIGGNDGDGLGALQQTTDGGYILGGGSFSNISGDKTENSNGKHDYWIIKLAPETVPTEELPMALSGLTIYPNPATDVLFVQTDKETTLQLQNAFGQILSSQTIQGEAQIDLARYPDGIYFLVEMETGIGHKIIKNK